MRQKNEQSKIDPVCGMDLTEYTDIPKLLSKENYSIFAGKFVKTGLKKTQKNLKKNHLLN